MDYKFLISVLLTLFVCSCEERALPAYLDVSKPVEDRVEDALSRMTMEEKVAVLHAQARFCSPGVPRLGIPELWFTDGPHGIRAEVQWDNWTSAGWTSDSCTAYPALTALAATFDPALAYDYGVAIGEEARYRNKDVLLGPGCNICRTPLCGRNFEYMGEDPALASAMVVPYVKGVQEQGVAACVKHFALNNQELHRHTTNVVVSDRALNEIYLPAFRAAVEEGGAWAMMGAYNLFDNEHCCHNSRLSGILKEEWNFDGVLISDWGGTHDTEQAIINGLDMEFGTWTDGLMVGKGNAYDKFHLAQPYLERLRSGEASEDVLNGKVRRVLRLMMRTCMSGNRGWGRFTCPEHSATARRIGAEGIVLLKNEENLLPLHHRRILVVGENAVRSMTLGGGSSSLKTKYEVSPLDGLRAALPDAEIVYVPGYSSSASVDEKDALDAATKADVVVFFGGLNKDKYNDAESYDREDWHLPYGQDSLILKLAAVNPSLVVVNISGNPVAMPWAEYVPAIVQGWYLGSEAGNSLADVLTGRVNPSGRLPFTIPVRLEDGPLRDVSQYPGIPRGDASDKNTIWDETYSEDLYVGYRWYEKNGIDPLFPFGHGLSYTSFEYGRPKISGTELRFSVTNSGQLAGAEVVQVYVGLPGNDRPVKELKAFRKVFIEAGETIDVSMKIDAEKLRQYDDGWILPRGEYNVFIGSSSTDIRYSTTIKL